MLIIATVVIFLNTLSLFFKSEAKLHDVLGSLWGFLMSTGFMLATLQPVIQIIKIYDVGTGIPEKFFNPEIDPKDLEFERKWLSE